MRLPDAAVSRRALLILLFVATTHAVAKEPAATPVFTEGAHCLFIGHSFFIPVARQFDAAAKRGEFPSHKVDTVFAGGPLGAPGSLWANESKRKQITAKLETGKVELFGMTAYGPLFSAFDDYKRWIDVALKHNPKTRFVIGHPWMLGGTRLSHAAYATAIEAGGKRLFQIVAALRKAYPDNHIYFIEYGKTAVEMKGRFEAGKLPGITRLVGRDKQSLFRDNGIGHAGPLMLDLSALSWLGVLYGVDVDTWKHTPDAKKFLDIPSSVVKDNEQFK